MGRRKAAEVDKKLEQVVRPVRDAKEKERQRQARLDLEKFVKDTIIENLIEKAHCYGESLEVCKDI